MNSDAPDNFLFKEECYAIQGAIFEVYREVGCGFTEPVYQECLMRELTLREIPCTAKPKLHLQYKGQHLEQWLEPDIICYESIILELKAVREFAPAHEAQLLNYLKATGLKVGPLVNFATYSKVTIKRLVRDTTGRSD